MLLATSMDAILGGSLATGNNGKPGHGFVSIAAARRAAAAMLQCQLEYKKKAGGSPGALDTALRRRVAKPLMSDWRHFVSEAGYGLPPAKHSSPLEYAAEMMPSQISARGLVLEHLATKRCECCVAAGGPFGSPLCPIYQIADAVQYGLIVKERPGVTAEERAAALTLRPSPPITDPETRAAYEEHLAKALSLGHVREIGESEAVVTSPFFMLKKVEMAMPNAPVDTGDYKQAAARAAQSGELIADGIFSAFPDGELLNPTAAVDTARLTAAFDKGLEELGGATEMAGHHGS